MRQPHEYCESLSLEHLLAMFFFGHVASLALHIEDRTEASGVPLLCRTVPAGTGRYWTVLGWTGRPAWPQAKVSFLSVDGKFMIKQLGSIPSVSLKRCVYFSISVP